MEESLRENSPLRDLSPSVRCLTPFLTPEKELNNSKFQEYLKKFDILELLIYKNNISKISEKYPIHIRDATKKQIQNTYYTKLLIYFFIFLLIILITFYF